MKKICEKRICVLAIKNIKESEDRQRSKVNTEVGGETEMDGSSPSDIIKSYE